jgi:N-acetylornithine carbamoyltransferase
METITKTRSQLRHFVDETDIPNGDWLDLVQSTLEHRTLGHVWHPPVGRSVALLFFNPSLRTRTSAELAVTQLGAHATVLQPGVGVWPFAFTEGEAMDGNEAEHIREAVGVLSRYYDTLGVRMFASMTDYNQDRNEVLMQTFVGASSVPVINLESAFSHPGQSLADAATLVDTFDGDTKAKKFVLTWTYHPKALPMAVANSALLTAARLGMEVTVARPRGYGLDPGVMAVAQDYAQATGGSVTESDDLQASLADADVIYAKAWGGMLGYADPKAESERRSSLTDWRVTGDLMRRTNQARFMHCLPVRRNVVVDDEVLDGRSAIHLDQAENRLHAQKAVLQYLWQE